jgi:hemerythrin-like metal-binding protein
MSMTTDRFVHYKLGIPGIDAEHFEMVKLMDNLIVAARLNSCSQLATEVDKIILSVTSHFLKEEIFIKDIGFKFANAHHEDHERLIYKLSNLKTAECKLPIMISYYIAEVEDIIVDHLDRYDRQFGDFYHTLPLELQIPYPI